MHIPRQTVTTIDTKIVVRTNGSERYDPIKDDFKPPSFLSALKAKKIMPKVTTTVDQEKSIN